MITDTSLGCDLRKSLRAEIDATQVREARLREQIAAGTDPVAPRTLAELELRETGLWDALGNTQQLP